MPGTGDGTMPKPARRGDQLIQGRKADALLSRKPQGSEERRNKEKPEISGVLVAHLINSDII